MGADTERYFCNMMIYDILSCCRNPGYWLLAANICLLVYVCARPCAILYLCCQTNMNPHEPTIFRLRSYETETLFHMISPDLLHVLCNSSSMETAAFINYAESQLGSRMEIISTWNKMSAEDMDEWEVGSTEFTPADFISEMKDWRVEALWCGWPVVCGQQFLYTPDWRPPYKAKCIPDEELQRTNILMCQYLRTRYNTKIPRALLDQEFQGDLHRHVMNIYDWAPICEGQMLRLGQIMHGLANVIQKHWGHHWCEDIMLVSWTAAQRAEHTSLFTNVRLVFAVLHTEHHWALLATLRVQKLAVVFDGKPETLPMKTASTWMRKYLGKCFGIEIDEARAEVPLQDQENWSCGHRIILAADYILSHFIENGWAHLPMKVPNAAINQGQIHKLSSEISCYVPPSCPLPSSGSSEAASKKLKLMDQPTKPAEEKPTVNQTEATTAQATQKEGENQPQTAERKPTVKKTKETPARRKQPPQKHTKSSEEKAEGKSTGHGSTDPSQDQQRSPEDAPGGGDENAEEAKELQKKWKCKKMEDGLKEFEEDLAHRVGFTHNVDFQKEHQRQQIVVRRGHWAAFLRNMKEGKAIGCAACRTCRDLVKQKEDASNEANGMPVRDADSAGAADEVPEPPAAADAQRIQRKRGRPRKDAAEWIGLAAWIAQNRSGIYREVDAAKVHWHCTLCDQALRLQRDGETFIHTHEKRKLHQAKLQLMKSSLESRENQNADKASEPVVQKPCSGASIEDQTLLPDLFEIRHSIVNFLRGGSPCAVGDQKGNALHKAAFTITPDSVHFRHVDCTGAQSVGLCGACFSLSRNPQLLEEVKRWSHKLDLIQLAGLLLCGMPEDIVEQQEIMQGRDYSKQDRHGVELDSLLKMKPSDAAARVRQQIVSIPRKRRSGSLQAIMDTRLSDIRELSPEEMERSVYLTLLNRYHKAVQDGVCHRSEFELASQIASGKLREAPLIDALFKSAMAKICKVERGCTQRLNSSRFIDSETALDLMVVLGRSKATENFLEYLGWICMGFHWLELVGILYWKMFGFHCAS